MVSLVAVAVATLATGACSPRTEETLPVATTMEETPITLRDVMLELGQSTNGVAAGIWAEDYEMIRSAATSIADHPGPNDEQRQAIMAALGEEVPNFIAADQLVHQLAVDLKTLADDEAPVEEILGRLDALESGCLSCHDQFRARLISAGVTPGSPTTATD